MYGGRQRLAVTWPCSDLQAVEIVGAVAATARTVAPIATVTAIKALAPIAAVAAALVAITIALGATHHGGRAFFVRIDPDGKITQNVLVEALQPFDLVDDGRRPIDIHQGEMGFAVLTQPIR